MIYAPGSGRVITSSIGAVEFSSIELIDPPPDPPDPPPVSDGDVNNVLKAIYDPVNFALRELNLGPASGSIGSKLSNEQILMRVYEPDLFAIRVVTVTAFEIAEEILPTLDAIQVIPHSYDPVHHAVRVLETPVPFDSSPDLDAERIFCLCYDAANRCMRRVVVGAASGTHGTSLDWRQVVKASYEHTSTNIRTVSV